jgi:hypothetical protein
MVVVEAFPTQTFEVDPFWCRSEVGLEAFALAIDFRELTQNLHRSYDFTDMTVLFVGAGRRQLFDPAIN